VTQLTPSYPNWENPVQWDWRDRPRLSKSGPRADIGGPEHHPLYTLKYFLFAFWPYLSNIFFSNFLVEPARYESSYRRTAHHATVKDALSNQSISLINVRVSLTHEIWKCYSASINWTETQNGRRLKYSDARWSRDFYYYTVHIFTAQCTLVHIRGLGIACRLSVCPVAWWAVRRYELSYWAGSTKKLEKNIFERYGQNANKKYFKV